MSKASWKGGALLAPVPPVLVSCGSGERANLLTVAWAGLINTRPPRLSISVRPSRHSYPLICESGEFVVNLPTCRLARAVDLWAATICFWPTLWPSTWMKNCWTPPAVCSWKKRTCWPMPTGITMPWAAGWAALAGPCARKNPGAEF